MRLLVALAALLVAPDAPDEPELTLRGRETLTAARVASVSLDGVTVQQPGVAPVVVGWHRVLEIRGQHAADAAPFMAIADKAWRAQSRLERSDAPGAEPLFEELFETLRHSRGPTAEAVALGLLRCRLARNAHTLAVPPWLTWLATRDSTAHPSEARDGWALPVDAPTGLVPDLPPIWTPGPALRVLASGDGLAARPPYSTRADAYAALYQHSARVALGIDSSMPPVTSRESGVEFVMRIVAAVTGPDAESRTNARAALAGDLDPRSPAWQQAWARIALGRSLLQESDEMHRRLGVIEFLSVPALWERELPYLSGAALAEAAVALETLGDPAGAARLRAEFHHRFPGHPSADWDAIRRHDEPTTSPAAAGEPPHATPVETARR